MPTAYQLLEAERHAKRVARSKHLIQTRFFGDGSLQTIIRELEEQLSSDFARKFKETDFDHVSIKIECLERQVFAVQTEGVIVINVHETKAKGFGRPIFDAENEILYMLKCVPPRKA